MDKYEKITGKRRGKQTVTLDHGTPGTADYLRKDYELPDPYTMHEHMAAVDDLLARYNKGERTTEGGTL